MLDKHGGAREERVVNTKIRNSIHVAFWNSLEDDMRLPTGPDYTRIIRVLGEIHDGVLDMASGNGAWAGARAISSVIDMDLINTQIKKGAFEWACCIRLVGDVEAILRSFPAAVGGVVPSSGGGATTEATATTTTAVPAVPMDAKHTLQDVTWAGLQPLMAAAADDASQRPRAFCTALRFMLDYVKAVRISVANARLRMLAPVMKDHGVDYERTKLDQRQAAAEAAGDASSWLSRTRAWVRQCVLSSCASSSVKIEDLTANDHAKGEAFNTVLREGVVSLVTSAGSFKPDSLAESLVLDKHRLAKLHIDFHSQVCLASVLVRLQPYIRQHHKLNPQGVFSAVVRSMHRALPPGATLAATVDAVEAALATQSPVQGSTRKAFCVGLLTEMRCPTDRVAPLMSSRLHALLLHAVSDTQDVYRDTDATNAVFQQLNLPQALTPLIPQLRATGRLLRKTMAVHLQVYATRYNSMLPVEAAAAARSAALVLEPAATAPTSLAGIIVPE